MARHTSRHAARRTWLGGFAVCLIVAFSGYLLVTNVRVNRTATVTSDTADLVEQRVEHVDQLQKDITDLSAQINTLKDFRPTTVATSEPALGHERPQAQRRPRTRAPAPYCRRCTVPASP